MFAELFAAVSEHNMRLKPYGRRALVKCFAQVRRVWHDALLNNNKAPNIATIDEHSLIQISLGILSSDFQHEPEAARNTRLASSVSDCSIPVFFLACCFLVFRSPYSCLHAIALLPFLTLQPVGAVGCFTLRGCNEFFYAVALLLRRVLFCCRPQCGNIHIILCPMPLCRGFLYTSTRVWYLYRIIINTYFLFPLSLSCLLPHLPVRRPRSPPAASLLSKESPAMFVPG